MAVWFCQCLCPGRHAILATAGEAETEEEASRVVRAPLRRHVVGMIADGVLNPWRALCDANRATWRYELRRTPFATLDDAMPTLRAIERQNMYANVAWGDIHKTSRPN
jgi:hypothetical protein